MPHYSIATAKEQLSLLMDKALAGEEVVITRRDIPIATMHPAKGSSSATDAKQAMARLSARSIGKTNLSEDRAE